MNPSPLKQFRRWVVPALIMVVCIGLCEALRWNDNALMIGWIGGAIATLQWPGISDFLDPPLN